MRNMLILLLLLALLGGCDLFRVRDSDPPTPPAPWNSYATAWDLCLENLEYCYEESRNAIKYAGLFTEDFAFHFAAQDINDYGLAPTLNRAQEQDLLLNLHNQSGDISVSLYPLPGQPDDIGPNDARIYRGYEVRRFDSDNANPVSYGGNLELYFQKSGGYWYIGRWYDYRATANPSWGKLKYDYLQ